MNINQDKMQKLAQIAKLYYLEDKTQNEIAKLYGVSRPLISRMLKEARNYGIVSIEIHSPFEHQSMTNGNTHHFFPIKGGTFPPSGKSDNATNLALAKAAVSSILKSNHSHFGIGWGTIIGEMISLLEQQSPTKSTLKTVCPLVGNSGVSNRNYHSNENVRIFAQQTTSVPNYLYTPAFAETKQELALITQMEHYKSIYSLWEQMDIALVNIGNFPSTPDFASGARYGSLLQQNHAVGRLLAYYFNVNGEIIHSDIDYAVQIPISLLSNCKNVIGICSSNTKPNALAGALRTGLIHYVIAPEETMQAAYEY